MTLKRQVYFVVFLMLLSGTVCADTYPAVAHYHSYYNGTYVTTTDFSSISAACAGSTWTGYSMPPYYSGTNCLSASPQNVNLASSANFSPYYTCPSGGTVSGTSCINASPCLSPLIRSTVSPYACYTPLECKYPETDNGNGICQDNTCPTGQNRNPVTNQCQTPPTCGSTENYDPITNTCYLKTLPCPGHSRMQVLIILNVYLMHLCLVQLDSMMTGHITVLLILIMVVSQINMLDI